MFWLIVNLLGLLLFLIIFPVMCDDHSRALRGPLSKGWYALLIMVAGLGRGYDLDLDSQCE